MNRSRDARWAVITSLLVCASTQLLAANCASVDDDAERLRCYDLDSGRPPSSRTVAGKPSAAKANPASSGSSTPPSPADDDPSWLMKGLTIRDVLEGSKKGASLSAVREQGETTYSLKLAALLDLGNRFLPESAAMSGWSWNVGAQFAKDTSTDKPVDGRTFAFGATGTLFGTSPVALVSTLGLQFVSDRIARTRDLGIRYSGTIVLPDSRILEGGIPYGRNTSARFIFPVVGLHYDRHYEDGKDGRLFGGHVGVSASYFPGGPLYQLHFFGDAVRARDFSKAGESEKRASTYYDIGVEYAFVNPLEKKNSAIVPTLSLKRTLGSNFLTGEAEAAKTVLSFTLTVN